MPGRDDGRRQRPTQDARGTRVTAIDEYVRSASATDQAPVVDERQIEREKDLLVQLAGVAAMAALDVNDPRNHRFLDWLARDLRDRQTPALQVETGLRAEAFARRMVARLRERERLPLEIVAGRPADRAAIAKGGVLQMAPVAAGHRCATMSDLAVAAGTGRELWDEPCERWIELPEGIEAGSYVGLTVAGDSMLPLLHQGDVLLVKLGADIAPGAIVVARHPDDGYVVKRVGTTHSAETELTSLNPAFAPLRIPRDPSLIVGTVVLTWCSHDRPAVASG